MMGRAVERAGDLRAPRSEALLCPRKLPREGTHLLVVPRELRPRGVLLGDRVIDASGRFREVSEKCSPAYP